MAVANPDGFKHTPLSHAAGQIRLLKVSSRPCNDEEEMHCELITCDVDTKPRYIAVSYTWGDPATTKAIFINDKTLVVRHNCWYVLWQACMNSVCHLLWIDAICINQSDDLEKSCQVAMMGDIYRNAEQVNVCLGPHGGNSQLFFSAVKEHAIFVEDRLRAYAKSGALRANLESLQRRGRVEPGLTDTVAMREFPQSIRAMFLQEMATSSRFNTLPQEYFAALTEARHCLTNRAYFSRLWICQEILLARQVVLMVGDTTVNFEDFLDFESDIVHYSIGHKYESNSGADFSASQEFLSIVNIRFGWSSTGMGLLRLTDTFSRFQCFDVRDRIFGMLGMVDWQGYPPMIPDYSKTTFEVGTGAISYMCRLPGMSNPTQEDNNTAWPITSAAQLASALGLDAENTEVKTRLQVRRSQKEGLKTPMAMLDFTPSCQKRYVEVLADFHCEIFANETTQTSTLHACLIDREDAADETVSRYVLDSEPSGSSLVYNRSCPRVRVSSTARPGDVILSFRNSGTDVGVVVRKDREGSGIHHIVGQANFHEEVLPCPGREKCSCGFERMPHRVPGTTMTVYFDIEDLLLFACQDLSRAVETESESDPSLHQTSATHAGEMFQIAALEDSRFVTSIVKFEDPFSSYAELINTAEDDTENEENHELAAKLQELQMRLNSWKRKTGD